MSYDRRYPSKKARREAAMRIRRPGGERGAAAASGPAVAALLPVPEDNDGEYEEPRPRERDDA